MAKNRRTNPVRIHEAFTPLAERAVRDDGTIDIKIISPGWGSSGYYSREVLERDIARLGQPGLHQYWNHPTLTETMERPERDLNDLAAVFVSQARWEDNGAEGPGMYARARVFAGYDETVDQIAEHIGVSIYGGGISEPGEAEGRRGPIVKEITRLDSVDFVTKPGAGGAIVTVFESAPGSGRLPTPEAMQRQPQTPPSIADLKEAQNLGEWLESRLHLCLTEIGDMLYGDGHINREERKAMSSAIGSALDAYRTDLMANASQLFTRNTWSQSEPSADIAGNNMSESQAAPSAAVTNLTEESVMADTQPNDTALAEAQQQLEEMKARNAKLLESLLLREAKEFVLSKLADVELADVVRARLNRDLASNPPVKEGKIDEEALTARIDKAVQEAQAEAAAILGNTGQIKGQGGSDTGVGNTDVTVPDLAESQKRTAAALSTLGLEVQHGD